MRSLLQPGTCETLLVVQWLRPPAVHTSSAGGLGLIPAVGISFHMPPMWLKTNKQTNRPLWEKLGVCTQVDKRTASTIKPSLMAIWLESSSDPRGGLSLKQLLGVCDAGASHPSSLGCQKQAHPW